MMRRPPRSTQSRSSAASDVYKRQVLVGGAPQPSLVEGVLLLVEGPLLLDQEVRHLAVGDGYPNAPKQLGDLRLAHVGAKVEHDGQTLDAGPELPLVSPGGLGQVASPLRPGVVLFLAEQHVVALEDDVLDNHVLVALEPGIGWKARRIDAQGLFPVDMDLGRLAALAPRLRGVSFPLGRVIGRRRLGSVGLDVGLAFLPLEASVLIPQSLVLLLESAHLHGQLLHQVQKPDDALPSIGVADSRQVKVFEHRKERRPSRARARARMFRSVRRFPYARTRPGTAPTY